MLKKILIALLVLVLIAAGGYFYLDHQNRTLSPPGRAEIATNDLTVSIDYSRPSVRDRMIFGAQEEGALQPYGIYWRLGANESTEIKVNQNVTFNGTDLDAGTYKLYAFPGKETFEMGVSTQIGTWGYSEPDYAIDVFRTLVPVEYIDPVTEQHTISLEETETGVAMVMEFEHVRLVVPIERR